MVFDEEIGSYKIVYRPFFLSLAIAGNLLKTLVGAGRFERPTPCAQGTKPQWLSSCVFYAQECAIRGSIGTFGAIWYANWYASSARRRGLWKNWTGTRSQPEVRFTSGAPAENRFR